jgi:DNA-binding LytR/AlgR family response regulator
MSKAVATAMIAEDEPLLASALRSELAAAWPALQIVATVADGHSAVAQALALQPDVLFFDIRMPGQSGLEAAAELADAWPAQSAGHKPFPRLVFVTAYDEYAVRAFDAQASDYLLKPVQPARLRQCTNKLQQALAAREKPADAELSLERTLAQLRALLAADAPSAPPLQFIQVAVSGKSGSELRMVPIADVLYLEAADKYVRVVTAAAEYLVRTPLKELLPELDAHQFWQIHRGTAVQVGHIERVLREDSGRLMVQLRGCAEKLAVSRLYAHLFKAM